MSLSFNGIIFRESYWLGQRLHYFLPPSNLDRSQAHLPSYVKWSGAALGQGKQQLKSVLIEWGLVGLLVKNFMVKVTQDNEHTWFLWIPLRRIQIMPGSSKAGVAKWCFDWVRPGRGYLVRNLNFKRDHKLVLLFCIWVRRTRVCFHKASVQ